MSSNDSSDAAVPADSSVDRRSAVREKAQLVHARQSRARRWRIALLSALAVVVVAAIGAGIAIALVTPSGKVVWGKFAQVTNNPELDGCINAVLLV